jgi:hypothetical protein
MATAKTVHFSGTDELKYVWPIRNGEFDQKFPGIKGKRLDSFSKLIGKTEDGRVLPVTRTIFYKANPSLHKCDARCRHAKGGNCECSCGGKYHGAGG